MDGPSNVLIYPTAFNHGVLTCKMDGNKAMSTLYFENTADTWFLRLDLPPDVFEGGGSCFRVDQLDAADGGTPIITVCDALAIGGHDMKGSTFNERQKALQDLLFGEAETVHGGDFRLMKARLTSAARIDEVLAFDIHNHPGVCIGAAFLDDTYNQYGGPSEGKFIVRKSRYPDVYELFVDGVQPVSGNNVAYVPTMELSRSLRDVFGSRNSVTLPCVYNEKRQRWTPVPTAPPPA